MARLLIVTATAPERDAVARSFVTSPVEWAGLDVLRAGSNPTGTVDFLLGGVGVAAAAASTATALAGRSYDLVICAGIAGGFAPVAIGDTVVASAVVMADLGAEDGTRFLTSSALGLGPERFDLDPAVTAELAERTGSRVGAVLSVSTVTGTRATADARLSRSPDAVAEAMEGAGVLTAARRHGVPFAEVRTVSNLVGPRDRPAWRIGPALDALTTAISAVARLPVTAA